EIEPIVKDSPNNQTGSKYASYTALDRAIRSVYTRHGFALSFDTEPAPNPADILVVLYITHGRHKRRYSIPMPCDGKGPRGGDVMSRTHAVGSAVTYGRRYLLCAAFNITTADDDGNQAGRRLPIQRVEPPIERYQPKRRDDYVPAPPP